MAKAQKKGIIREYVEAFGVALIAALILRALVIQAFRIPTGSMKDTLLVGDFLLVNKFIYGAKTPDRIPILDINLPSVRFPAFKKPHRGEVVVFKYPKNPKLDYIKRCVGVPGDTIELRNGDLYVNGKPEGEKKFIGRKYDPAEGHYIRLFRITMETGKKYTIRQYEDPMTLRENFGPKVVPPKHLFMMGDNRNNSQDSRYWGFMPYENLVGEALIIYWSWNKRVPLYKIFHKIRWARIGDLIR